MLLEVYLKLNKIERLIHKENLETARLYGPLSDISHGQGRILAYLKTKEPMSVKELAELMEIRPQSLNDHLRRMQRDGLIIREPSPDDKRKVLISLTPKARDLDISYKSYESIFDGFSEDELGELDYLLGKIEENLINELGDELLDEPKPPVPPHGPRPVPPHLRGREDHPIPPHLRGPEDRPVPPREPIEIIEGVYGIFDDKLPRDPFPKPGPNQKVIDLTDILDEKLKRFLLRLIDEEAGPSQDHQIDPNKADKIEVSLIVPEDQEDK